ncbi:MAG: amino acid adenylation domain-containing protein [Candidatus Omnitrophota bacterium]
MNIVHFLSKLKKMGIVIQLDNGNLRIKSLNLKPSPEILNEIRTRKEEIVRFFSQIQTGKAEIKRYAEIEPVEAKAYYPLSSAQKRLYFLQQMDSRTIAYNIPWVLSLGKEVDINRLEWVFKRLVERHESLRTSFEMVHEVPVQRVHERVDFSIEYDDFTKEPMPEDIHQWFIRPFDLSKVPLFHLMVAKVENGNHIWMFDIHHIVSDGTSVRILNDEFLALYEGQSLNPLRIQYKDFSVWQNHLIESGGIKNQEEYWFGIFQGEIPRLNMPLDYPRPGIFNFRGDSDHFKLEGETAKTFRADIKRLGGTLFMGILTVLNMVFYKYTGQTDIVIGSGIAGRPHADLQGIIGMFINALAMRNYPEGEKSYESLFEEVRKNSIHAFENQDVQFETLVETLNLERDPSRNPLFDIMLIVQNFGWEGRNKEKDDTVPERKHRTSKFDMSFSVDEDGEGINIVLEYYTEIFKPETIARFGQHLMKIIEAVVSNPTVKLDDIEMIADGEKEEILYCFNNTAADYPTHLTVHELFENQVTKGEDHLAFIGSASLQTSLQLTYNELNERSNRLAVSLKEKGVQPDTIVAVKMERSIEMIIGILGILKAGGAYLPIDPDYPQDRIDYMLKDSGTKFLLATEVTEDTEGRIIGFSVFVSTNKEGETIRSWEVQNVLFLDHLNLSSSQPLTFLPPHPLNFSSTPPVASVCSVRNISSLTYVIYTSGTTGKPKGVLVNHDSVFNTIYWRMLAYQMKPGDRSLQLFSFAFDGFVTSFFTPIVSGAVVIQPDTEQTKDITYLRKTIVSMHVTHFICVPSLYRSLLEICTPEEFASITCITLAGEAVQRDLVEKSGQIRIINEYGPTEGTVVSSYYPIDKPSAVIPIGKPIANVMIYIIDNKGHLKPIGIPGELAISGKGLARGYLNNPELTNDKFVTIHPQITPRKSFCRVQGGSFYKTGDLARYLSNGNIEFLGRIDQQVKVRGFRIELGEIQSRLTAHETIKDAIVIVKKDSNGDSYLCSYVVTDGNLSIQEIRQYLLNDLPGYMVPSYFIEMEKIPLTPNGKIDTRALPEPGMALEPDYIAPRDEIEARLTLLFAGVLGTDQGRISIDRSFFELGGNSLKTTVLIARIHKEFNVLVSLADFFKTPTVDGLAHHIRHSGAGRETFHELEPVEEREYYPLSSAQKRLYLLQHINPGSTVYNMPQMIPLVTDGGMSWDEVKLEHAFQQIIQRHESLRTSFHMICEEPVQRIHPNVSFRFELTHVSMESFIRPFDLSDAPLIRAGCLKEDNRLILMVDMHHIVSDGVSHEILKNDFNDFMADYQGEKLLPLRVQYKDFSAWQTSEKGSEKLRRQERYWLTEFEGEIPVLDIPTDYPRPAVQRFEGSRFSFHINENETSALKRMALDDECTLFMVLIALFNIVLSALTGQEDIVIGTPVAGRNHADLDKIIGVFINTLALRNFPSGDKTFPQFLNELKKRTLDAFENQDYPFENLVEKIGVNRDAGRNPLLDVMFSMQNVANGETNNNNTVVEPEERYENKTSKFDMVLHGMEMGNRLYFSFEYCTRLFRRETIERFAGYLKQAISHVSRFPGVRISDIDLLTEDEKYRLLVAFNDTDADYPKNRTIHNLFEDHVIKGKDHLAIIGSTSLQLTYGELNERSNRLAVALMEKGVQPDTIVAMMMKRSVEMIIAILGILKAGGAYLPIDPDYPQDRIDYMLMDSGGQSVIDESFVGADPCVCPCLFNEKKWGAHAGAPLHSCLAYVIYTSGTTGKPKGSLITHRNVVRLMINDQFPFEFNNRDVWTLFHSYCFDFSVWEMYGALLYGGKLIIIPLLTAKDPGQYLEVLKRECVTVLNQTPAAFYQLSQKEMACPSSELPIRYVIFGGEALNPAKLAEWNNKYPQTRLINMFGITETTVHVTIKEIGENEIRIGVSNIGKPIPTLQLYILDRRGKLVPTGVSGELVVGGDGPARGYLNRPELTHDKFIINPLKSHFKLPLTKRFCPAFYKKRAAGGMLYKSGDLGRYLTDGDIEYLGRMDHQVKVRGFRIELGEIESRLLKKKEIKDAIVLAREDEPGNKYLCAYIVLNQTLTLTEIRDYLSAELPGYMVPSYIVILDRMPLTSNGKIDRKALPGPVQENVMTESDFAAPRNRIEKTLVDIWKKALKLEKVGIRDSYFHLGGDSMKAIHLLNMINKELSSDLKIVDLFTNETIEKLAECLTGEDPFVSDTEREQVIREIESLKARVLAQCDFPEAQIDDIDDIYPMSDIEKGMVYHSLRDPFHAVYHDQMVHQMVYENFDPERFKKAVSLMVQKHPILRTGFHIGDFDEPVQIVYRSCALDVLHIDLSVMDRSDQETYILNYIEQDRKEPFRFTEPPLWRLRTFALSKDHIVVLWVCHHAIIDGWSDASFKTELNNIYIALASEPGYQPEGLKSSYRDFIIEQLIYKKKPEVNDYWIQELADYKRLRLGAVSKNEPSVSNSYPFDLGIELMNELNRVAKENQTQLKHLCFGAYMYMLNMLSYENDITAGLVTHNRPLCEDGEKILGCFLNTVPVRFQFAEQMTWSEYIGKVDRKMKELFHYDRLPLFEIAALIGENGNDRNPIFDTLFNYVDFHVYDDAATENNSGENNLSLSGKVSTNTLLNCTVSTTRGRFLVSFTCSGALFGNQNGFETVSKWFRFFEKVLQQYVHDPEAVALKDDLLSLEERKNILDHFNRTEKDYPKTSTLHRCFEQQVERTPDQVAVVDSSIRMTYNRLNEEADSFAFLLKEKGIRSDLIIAIMVERSVKMIACILGILKAGGAYLPIDPSYPQERINYILKDSGAKLVFLTERTENTEKIVINTEKIVIKLIDEYERPVSLSSVPSVSSVRNNSSIAYVIYTSGTTGKPKGVLVDHRNAVNIVHWFADVHQIGGKHVLQVSDFTFDASVNQVFGTLISGASLYIVSKETRSDIEKMRNYVNRHQIHVINFVPSYLKELLGDGNKLKSIHTVLSGAETLDETTKERILRNGYRLVNQYGPTETTVDALAHECSRLTQVSLGKPVYNVRVYILDIYRNLLPIGVIGELYVGGDGVARGYLNRPELTSERFCLRRPAFCKKRGKNFWFERLYRTGDLAQWLPDGNIAFFGRVDHQVKIRGYRIELAEIENRICHYRGVKEAVVLSKEDTNGDAFLCAYVVWQSEDFVSETGKELKNDLSNVLPDYMIPSYFISMEKIPLTRNGKIDRSALPMPGLKVGEEYVSPQTETETKLVTVWASVLGMESSRINADQSFFQLGGHSLKAAALISKIQKEWNINIPLIEVFKNSTIQRLASYIDIHSMEDRINIDDEKLVLLKRGTEREKNLFLIHDGTGEVDGYIEFCKHLIIEFNIWGIKAAAFESLTSSTITIPELAREYIASMQKVQDQGPYYIVGWSLGGTIAFEMAAQLEAVNREIACLVLIDSVPPFEGLWKQARSLNKFLNIGQLLSHARAHYRPDVKLKSSAIYFQASASRFDIKFWENYFIQPLKYFTIEGDHYSIFRSPHVENLAETFNRII